MIVHLTAPRASAVQRFFQTTSQRDLLGAYAWCQAVSARLLPILGDFEVALRNALHKALSQHYGNQDSWGWMQPNPAVRVGQGQLQPTHHKLGPQPLQDLERVRRKLAGQGKPVSPDDMVAALAFGFWEQLIKHLDHKAHPKGLQGQILVAVFPGAPDRLTQPHGSLQFKQRVVRLLNQIREVRNRIGHHDAIWSCPEFDQQGHTGFYPKRPRHTLKSIRLLAERVAWLAGWIDPRLQAHIEGSDHWQALMVLLTRQSLQTYRGSGGVAGTSLEVLRLAQQTERRLMRRPVRRRDLVNKRSRDGSPNGWPDKL